MNKIEKKIELIVKILKAMCKGYNCISYTEELEELRSANLDALYFIGQLNKLMAEDAEESRCRRFGIPEYNEGKTYDDKNELLMVNKWMLELQRNVPDPVQETFSSTYFPGFRTCCTEVPAKQMRINNKTFLIRSCECWKEERAAWFEGIIQEPSSR